MSNRVCSSDSAAAILAGMPIEICKPIRDSVDCGSPVKIGVARGAITVVTESTVGVGEEKGGTEENMSRQGENRGTKFAQVSRY